VTASRPPSRRGTAAGRAGRSGGEGGGVGHSAPAGGLASYGGHRCCLSGRRGVWILLKKSPGAGLGGRRRARGRGAGGEKVWTSGTSSKGEPPATSQGWLRCGDRKTALAGHRGERDAKGGGNRRV
jgi:hypothetical protein